MICGCKWRHQTKSVFNRKARYGEHKARQGEYRKSRTGRSLEWEIIDACLGARGNKVTDVAVEALSLDTRAARARRLGFPTM
jgi:hypothetical protein